MRIGAIILAAGGSRRLGRPKQLVQYHGETLLARTMRVAREAGARPVVTVLGAEYDAIAAAVDLSEVRLMRNLNWAQGIASSIHAGLRALEGDAPDADGALILTCDQPQLTVEHLRVQMAAFEAGVGIVASEYAGARGVPAIFPRVMFVELYALSGDTGARALLKRPGSAVVTVDFPGGEVDVDVPEDLEKLS
jgi:molybdenum cofactor cytidylyltransferase